MTSSNNDADNHEIRKYYKYIIPFIQENSSILNIGCGTHFNFENFVLNTKKVNFTSTDIIDIKSENKFVKFKKINAENEFLLQEKFDLITFFEVIEHVDNTDIFIKNCYNNLNKGGILIFSIPNLSSIYSRIELLFGLQPHILEISNIKANYGSGYVGSVNNPTNTPLHHIRGITHRAMKEMILDNKFKIEKIIGHDKYLPGIFYKLPSLSSVTIYICKK